MFFRKSIIALSTALATLLSVAAAPVTPHLRPRLDVPTMSELAISPSGNKIAFALRSQDKNFLAVLDLSQPNARPEPLGHIAYAGITEIWWKGEDVILAQLGDSFFAGDFQSFDLKAGKVNKLASLNRSYYVALHNLLADDPEHVLIAAGDLRKLNVRSGKLTTVEKRPLEAWRWVLNEEGNPVVAVGSHSKKDFLLWRPKPNAPWERRELGPDDKPDYRIARVHPDGRRLLAWDSTKPGPASVVALDPSSMTTEPILAQPDVEIDYTVSFGNSGGQVKALQYENDTVHRFFLDRNAEAYQATIDAALPSTTNTITSLTPDGEWAIVESSSDRDPGSYHLFKRQTGKARFLGPRFPSAHPKDQQPSRRFSFKNRNGQTIFGRLILPAASNKTPAAFVLAGPWLIGPRARATYDAWGQAFAANGYASVRIDARGTSGYGRQFEEAGAFGLDRTIPEDMEDGVSYLAGEGMIDRERVGFFSETWGGIVGLQAVAGSPLFKCWVNWSGPLDLTDIRYEALSLWTLDADAAVTEMGGKRAVGRYVKSLNPLKTAATLTIPTFHFYQHSSYVPYAEFVSLQNIVKKTGHPAKFIRGAETKEFSATNQEYYKAAEELFIFLAAEFPALRK